MIDEHIPDNTERRVLQLQQEVARLEQDVALAIRQRDEAQAQRDRYRSAIDRALMQVAFGLGRVVQELQAVLD